MVDVGPRAERTEPPAAKLGDVDLAAALIRATATLSTAPISALHDAQDRLAALVEESVRRLLAREESRRGGGTAGEGEGTAPLATVVALGAAKRRGDR